MKKVSSWKAYQQAPWGRIFYSVSRATIQRHLRTLPPSLHILDIGGGNGSDAIFYAEQGHRVTLLDSSAAMIEESRQIAEVEQLSSRISCYHADLTEVPTLFPEPVFDVLLCHNVIQYIEYPESMLRTVTSVLKAHGLLSLIGVNRYSEAYRAILQRLDPQAAQEKLQERVVQSQVFQQPMQLYTAFEMIAMLQDLRFIDIQQYGIRCVFDYIPDNDIKAESHFFAQIEQLEHLLSATYPYYLLARYIHLLAEKS